MTALKSILLPKQSPTAPQSRIPFQPPVSVIVWTIVNRIAWRTEDRVITTLFTCSRCGGNWTVVFPLRQHYNLDFISEKYNLDFVAVPWWCPKCLEAGVL